MIGLDVGGDRIKVALPGNRLVFPSSLTFGGNPNNKLAQYQGQMWQVGQIPTRPQTVEDLARLTILTLTELSLSPLSLTLAVPVDLFSQRTLWVESLQGVHQVHFPKEGRTQGCVIEEVTILPQGYAAFFSYALEAGQRIEERIQKTLIIDCGASALNIAVTTEQGTYNKLLSLTLRDFWIPLVEGIAAAHQTSVDEVVSSLATGQPLQTLDGSHDCRELFEKEIAAKQPVLAAHLSAVTKTNPSQVLVCGGNAEVLFPAIQLKWPQAVVLPSPLHANALGCLSYALRHKNCSPSSS